MADPDIAFVVTMLGVLGIYAGLCGRILLGVAGGVLAVVGLASLRIAQIHWWAALAVLVPFGLITIFLLKTAISARANKTP